MSDPNQPVPAARPPLTDRRPSPAARMVMRGLGLLAGLTVLALFIGFMGFVRQVGRLDTEFGRRADAVVALTGGAERIADALSVLDEQRAQRLLISGVGEKTPVADLVRQSGRRDLFACCVDIDRAALNTVGNAVETARWAQEKGYRSLLVVTSNYHMPRAMVELRRHLKNVELIPHPVIAESIRADLWWRDLSLGRLLFSEYLKYLVSEARSRLIPDHPLRR